MPRRALITALERASLLSVPADRDALIRHYTFSPEELVWINSRREDFNRLGFAVQLSYMKYPGIVLDAGATPDENLLGYVRACPKFPVFQKRSIFAIAVSTTYPAPLNYLPIDCP